MTVKAPKKLIEVALPLDDINIASAREKSIRHGHPSTLHLWWARRPLAAARAVLFAQMVNDPGYERSLGRGVNKKEAAKERERLFEIIKKLVQWENTNNESVLDEARAEIWKSWRETCALNKNHPRAAELFNPDNLPAFHDPFAGGGSIPLEAQRLGLESYASDVNPVAVLINKAMIEIPPKFAGRKPVGPAPKREKQPALHEDWSGAKGLAEDVRRYGQWMREEAQKRIGHLYPPVEVTAEMAQERHDLKPLVGKKLAVIALLWARTVKSPNPAYSHVEVPLAATFMLSTKPGKEAYVEPMVEGDGYRFTVKVGKPANAEQAKNGTKAGGHGANFFCLLSGTPIDGSYIKSEAQAGRMGARLMAVVAEGLRARVYLSPTSAIESIAKQAEPSWCPDIEFFEKALGFRVGNYGMKKWSDLFTPRQLVALTTFSDLVQEARERVQQDTQAAGMADDGLGLDAGGTGATAYADAVAMYLAFAVSKAADRNSSLCVWENQMDRLRGTFGRQALPMTWDYVETNPFAGAAGDIYGTAHSLCEVLDNFYSKLSARAEQQDACSQSLSADKVVSTDPPYYDNIGYADISDFFYIWLRHSLKPVFPDLFATLGGCPRKNLSSLSDHSCRAGALRR
jgi:putative DNA methylase